MLKGKPVGITSRSSFSMLRGIIVSAEVAANTNKIASLK